MHTSILWLALTGLSAADRSALVWTSDYGQARKHGAAQNKPLAVFLSPGKDSWQKVSLVGGLGSEVEKLLAERYVCVHLDTATTAGRQLASNFELSGDLG